MREAHGPDHIHNLVSYYAQQAADLRRRIAELERFDDAPDHAAELVGLRSDLGIATLARRLNLKNTGPIIPRELDAAVSHASATTWRSLWVPMGGDRSMLITVGKARPESSLATVGQLWRYLDGAAKRPATGVRLGPIVRAEMPQPLAAYIDEQAERPTLVLGTWLINGLAVDAARAIRVSWRARHPRGAPLMALMLLPLLLLRGLRHALLPGQAAAPAIASTAALPIVTAAALSSPAIVPVLEPHRAPATTSPADVARPVDNVLPLSLPPSLHRPARRDRLDHQVRREAGRSQRAASDLITRAPASAEPAAPARPAPAVTPAPAPTATASRAPIPAPSATPPASPVPPPATPEPSPSSRPVDNAPHEGAPKPAPSAPEPTIEPEPSQAPDPPTPEMPMPTPPPAVRPEPDPGPEPELAGSPSSTAP